MITSFRDKDTMRLFDGACPRHWLSIRKSAERKLTMLDDVESLDTLRVLRGNRLEQLKGDRAGQWSIRINDQWRICFNWEEGNATQVEIVDYH